jgi:radical SAM protein with 4Fe4S-binding SPASM domain
MGSLFSGKPRVKLPQPGTLSYRLSANGRRAHIHLRIEASGEATLLIDANQSVRLNPSAAAIAWLHLEGLDEQAIFQQLKKRYRVGSAALTSDIAGTLAQLKSLISDDQACPIHDLNLDVIAPFSSMPSAPYRMDLALTYRCNNECPHCYNSRPRAYPELDRETWMRLLEKMQSIGIPHVCFTGGESTLRDDLPDLIHHAALMGMVTGLLTNGRRLAHPGYVEALASAGLDHVQITLESHLPHIHDRMVAARGAWQQTVNGIRAALNARLYVMTNTTLLADNTPSLEGTLEFLGELGVPTVGFNALIRAGHGASVGSGVPEADLPPLLDLVRRRTEAQGQRLIWYTPTQYCHFDPVQMELGVKGCTAARYNMCVEPDGAVIPCQSYYQALGNLLEDSWESIWNHDLARYLRERRYVPTSCQACPVLSECGGGCPLTMPHQAPVPAAVVEAPLQHANL